MDWLFAKIFGETLPSDEMIRWLFATYEWLLRHRGGFDEFRRTRQLILPQNENFQLFARGGHDLAEEVFVHVKRYARMLDWNCRLEAHEDEAIPDNVATSSGDEKDGLFGRKTAAGTFSMEWDHSDTVITYSPRQLNNLQSLVATFAHELSHFYLATVPFDPPAGPTAEEHATDVCAVFIGFGVFLANTVCSYAHGAVVSRKGYLGEVALSYSLAIFCELQELQPGHVRKHLNSNPKSFYASAVRDIRKRWMKRLENLKGIEPLT